MLHGTGSWCLRRFFHTTPRVTDKKLLDSLQLCVQGGSGGRGNLKLVGLGGDGGSVIFKGTSRRRLRGLQQAYEGKVIKADNGKSAEAARILGDSAKDRLIEVPVGISVSTRKGRLLGDINAPGDILRVATGAKGGGPENDFKGRVLPFQFVNLDLKLVADVGLVGFPNAGKSTLLTRLSNAHPKIASYPFTTLQPQLGVMSLEEEERLSLIEGRTPRRVTIADLPGLIEGASNNVGLGHEFLKHVERTKVLLFVIDVNGFYFGTEKIPKARDPFQSLCLLLEELRHYDASLLRRPALLCVNKVEDDAGIKALLRLVAQLNDFDAALEAAFSSKEELTRLESLRPPQFRDIHAISAEKRINIKPVMKNLFNMVLEQELTKTDKEEEEADAISSGGVRGRF